MNHTFTTAALFLIVGTATCGLLLFPREISLAIRDGLSLCADTLFPTLFPFLVLSGFLVKSGLAQQIGLPLEHIAGRLFRLPGTCSTALILGLIGGYPTGAKTVVESYQNGQCSRREAERMLAFCNNCGPGFLISTVGFGLFGSIHCGLLLYAAHASAAILTGMLFASSSRAEYVPRRDILIKRKISLPVAFVTSVTEAMHGFINLAAFVLCFSAIIRLIEVSEIVQKLSFLLPFSKETASSFLFGFLEMSNGALHPSRSNPDQQIILTAAIVGWGGLSVHCQVLSLLQNTDLSPILYFKGKAVHALICALLSAIIFGILPVRFLLLVLPLYGAFSYFRKKAVEKRANVYYNAS